MARPARFARLAPSAAVLSLVAVAGLAGTVHADDTSAPLVLSGGAVSVTESNPSAGTTAVDVTFALSAPAPDEGVTFDYHTVDGSATAPTDYLMSSGTTSIPAGATSTTVQVEIVNDTVHEDDESFAVVATSVRLGANAIARVSSLVAPRALQPGAAATVTIHDDDPADAVVVTASEASSSPTIVAGTSPAPHRLPSTGAATGLLAAIALVVTAAGTALTALGRRRPTAV